ncbi:MAG: hypothetical protein QW790_01620 [Candidatus Aenigmatarchaeota archaeon]
MNRFGYGVKRAIGEIIGGFVTSVIVDAFISSGLLNPAYVFLFALLNILGLILLLLTMPAWGITYLLGWIFGVVIMFQSGLIGILEAILYLGVPIFVIMLKIKSWFE